MIAGRTATGNDFGDLPTDLTEKLVTIHAESVPVQIERIVSTGHASFDGFWYDRDEAEWVVVMKRRHPAPNGERA